MTHFSKFLRRKISCGTCSVVHLKLSTWLIISIIFIGYKELKQNINHMSKIKASLNDKNTYLRIICAYYIKLITDIYIYFFVLFFCNFISIS